MPWNLSALRKGYGLALVLLITTTRDAAPVDWYRSNAAGMILEGISSRLAALRNQYCLSVEFMAALDLPEPLQAYYRPSYRIELHTLYEDGEESRRQWIFRNEQGKTMLVSSLVSIPIPEPDEEGEPAPASEEPPPESSPEKKGFTGFIEIYDVLNGTNLLREERHIAEDGTETITAYFYSQQLLIRAETRLKTAVPVEGGEDASSGAMEEKIEPVLSDYYRYSRSHALRAVERVYHQEVSTDTGLTRLHFPHLGLQAAVEEQKAAFVSPSTAYGSEFMQDLFLEAPHAGDRVIYTTDERGRIVTEITQDEAGTIVRDIHNTWNGDRLASVDWKAGEEERRIEYTYDEAGDRILERNYLKGVLERLVRKDKGQEIEELYMNGRLILRAVWEDGRKISEERVRP
ncbi:MAG: hypothetical protein LBU25_03085 [Treponema sp.]|jgi:hypothetical protein|nr:hypothetical protein [Treponema sp.]